MEVYLNGKAFEANPGETVLQLALRNGIYIPHLCYHEKTGQAAKCRACVVEIEGRNDLQPSCAFPVSEGMKIKTHSPKVLEARKNLLELMLSNHPDDCLYCVRNGNCDLRQLADEYGIQDRKLPGKVKEVEKDTSSPSIIRDPSKCILCGKCVRVCEDIQGVVAIELMGRGFETFVGIENDKEMGYSSCINCGQCVLACPTGALTEVSHVQNVIDAINDPDKVVVVQHAPSISVSIAEEMGYTPGKDFDGIMCAAFRKIGFDYVFDTSFSADLTIMEEGSELVHRINNNGALPQFTSCSPGWIKYIEQFYPELLDHVSTCKSPQQMMGAIIKSMFAEKMNVDPSKIFSVSVMPCTAKKFEAQRPEMGRNDISDVDAVLTTRELGKLFHKFGIDFHVIKPEKADTPFGDRTTAGKIFGASGGVMEAAIRSAYFLITGKELKELKVEAVRGLEGIKEAKVNINGIEVGVAVAHTLKNAKILLDQVRDGRKDLHFIEIMTCPGGCVGGGGQPYGTNVETVIARTKALYSLDDKEKIKSSHNNPWIKRIYDEFLGEPLSHKSHELLHTDYHKREM